MSKREHFYFHALREAGVALGLALILGIAGWIFHWEAIKTAALFFFSLGFLVLGDAKCFLDREHTHLFSNSIQFDDEELLLIEPSKNPFIRLNRWYDDLAVTGHETLRFLIFIIPAGASVCLMQLSQKPYMVLTGMLGLLTLWGLRVLPFWYVSFTKARANRPKKWFGR